MGMRLVGLVDPDRLHCTGSFTKELTTFVCLSLLAEQHSLAAILDDEDFLNSLAKNPEAAEFLALFQKHIGSKFTLRDLCSYYTGLPYTFDLSEAELEKVEAGQPFKHHSIPDEKTFLWMCANKITPVYKNRCKFHYSELSILFLGYFIEKVFGRTMEELYQHYLLTPYQLKASHFSRQRPPHVYCQDLSDRYDYPSIAILDHGYFCYSNGFYTTLNDTRLLLDNLLKEPIFQQMTDLQHARAASNRLLNGLATELRLAGNDLLYGYEGLSYSGCNLWAWSTRNRKGYIAFSNDEEKIYDEVYGQWDYQNFDPVPDYTQQAYKHFLQHYDFQIPPMDLPREFQGTYHRVRINEKELNDRFILGKDFMVIRNPEEIRHELVFVNQHYCIKGKDGVHGAKVGLYTAKSGNRYFLFDGTLYKKLSSLDG